jgi:hypothetical protein
MQAEPWNIHILNHMSRIERRQLHA